MSSDPIVAIHYIAVIIDHLVLSHIFPSSCLPMLLMEVFYEARYLVIVLHRKVP